MDVRNSSFHVPPSQSHKGLYPATLCRRDLTSIRPPALGRIRDISSRADPAHCNAHIPSSPTLKYLCKLDGFLVLILLSKGLLETLDVTLEEVLKDPKPIWRNDSQSQRVNDTVQADPRWLRCEIAFFEAVHEASLPGEVRWWHSIGAPIAESGAMLWEGRLAPHPKHLLGQAHPVF